MDEANFAGDIIALRCVLAQCIAKIHNGDRKLIHNAQEQIIDILNKAQFAGEADAALVTAQALPVVDDIYGIASTMPGSI